MTEVKKLEPGDTIALSQSRLVIKQMVVEDSGNQGNWGLTNQLRREAEERIAGYPYLQQILGSKGIGFLRRLYLRLKR